MTQAILDDAWLRRYEEVLEQIREKQEHLRSVVLPRLEDLLSTAASVLGGVAGALLEPKLREVLHGTDEFVIEVGVLVESGGLPLRLGYDARGWADLHDQSTIGIHRLGITTPHVRESWQGLSAYAYLYVHGTQLNATDRLSEVCSAVAAQLVHLAKDALTFYLWLLGLVTLLELQLAGAIASAATGAGLPVACQNLMMASVVLAALRYCVQSEQQRWREQAAIFSKIVDVLTDHGTFPGGRWPPANTDGYRDGSVSDGTPTDWTAHDSVTHHGPTPS